MLQVTTHRRVRRVRSAGDVALTLATAFALAVAVSVAPLGGAFAATGTNASAKLPVAPEASGRTETPLPSASSDVVASLVTMRAPLPASAGPHPASCDSLSYLRYRSASGPAAAADADRILLAEPGALAGASSFDQLARKTVEDSAAAGKHVEFWALDRRANCLEDNTGFVAAVRANDPSVALGYYTKGATVDGRTFAGYVPESQLGWLSHMGMQQTVLDEYTVLTSELPDPAVRAKKVWCGGHSLGGVVTAFFTMSDFDGDPNTTADAGYHQCAGYFALDTKISTAVLGIGEQLDAVPQPAGMDGLVGLGGAAVQAAFDSGLLPRAFDIPVINPETVNLLALSGVFARLAPDGVSPLPGAFGNDSNVQLALRFLLSRDLGAFLTGQPDIQKVKITNEGSLGSLMDDNSSPISIIQESVGFFAGGPVSAKSFPDDNDLLTDPQLKGITALASGTQPKAVPTSLDADYTWLNYDRIAGATIPPDETGKPYTTAASEVTDIHDLARNLAPGNPIDFTEHYFPLSMITDSTLWMSGDHSVVPTAVHADGPKQRPTVSLLGAEGVVAPAGTKIDPDTLVLPGYQHLDVLTAAAEQNDGRPEAGAQYLTDFVLSH